MLIINQLSQGKGAFFKKKIGLITDCGGLLDEPRERGDIDGGLRQKTPGSLRASSGHRRYLVVFMRSSADSRS